MGAIMLQHWALDILTLRNMSKNAKDYKLKSQVSHWALDMVGRRHREEGAKITPRKNSSVRDHSQNITLEHWWSGVYVEAKAIRGTVQKKKKDEDDKRSKEKDT